MDVDKIPKIIHYCWFGGKEKPPLIKRCISSWEQILSDYEIKEWNENSFDLNSNDYVRDAYKAGKFAFVSDFVRVFALYNYGGIYLDTDVEVFKSFNEFLHYDSFWGFEQENYVATSTIGAAKANQIIEKFLNSYNERDFIKEDGTLDTFTNVALITKILKELGVKPNGEKQDLPGMGIFFPQTYFSPYDYINCRKIISDNTYAMHHFYKSWLPFSSRVKGLIKNVLAAIIGGENIARLRKVYK
ncbi:glycosyltransferase [Peribacillus kribbensis]|uniref:glycosyltransferase family 32 protein n=1 Tax=Peribacillus kribbensis TaxID=356658 RepID=UPI000550C907